MSTQLFVICKKCGKETLNGGDGLCVKCRTLAFVNQIAGIAETPRNFDMPILNPAEHAEIEAKLGRSLSNLEAHAALRQLTLEAAANDDIEGRISQ